MRRWLRKCRLERGTWEHHTDRSHHSNERQTDSETQLPPANAPPRSTFILRRAHFWEKGVTAQEENPDSTECQALCSAGKQECARHGPFFKMGMNGDRGEEGSSPAHMAWACGMVCGGESQERLPRPCAGPQRIALPEGLLPDSSPPQTLPALPPKHVSWQPPLPRSVLVLACHLLLGWHTTSPTPTTSHTAVKAILLQPIVFLDPNPFKCLCGFLKLPGESSNSLFQGLKFSKKSQLLFAQPPFELWAPATKTTVAARRV